MAPLLPRPSPERQEPANIAMPMENQMQAPNAGEGMGYDNWQEDWMRADMAFNQTVDMAAAHSMTALNGTWGGMAQAFQNPFAMAYDIGPTGDANQAFDMQQCDFEATSPMSAPQPRRFTTGVLRQYDQALFPHLTARDSVRPSIEHDGRQPLQYGNTGPGQPDYGHRSSEDNAAQYTSPPNNKVALPPLSQQQPLPPQPASLAPAMGPLSSQVIVPARPKPGRKPLPQEDAVDRRRVQNRMAQRNFRDKRAQRVSELTVDNDRLRREMEAMTRKHENQLENQRQEYNSLKRKVSDLEKDLDAAVKRAEDAENKLHSVDSLKRFKEAGFPNPVLQTTTTSAALPSIATNWRGPASSYTQSDNPSIMTPPDEGWPETDMTNFWTSRNADRNQPKPNEDNNTQWLGSGMDIDRDDNDGCGFCTDESNCSCLQSKKAEPVAIAPGGCDACIRDPARAEACRALAAKTEFSPLPMGGSEQRNDSMAPPPPPSGSTRLMSCSKFIDRVETQGPGLRVPSISELFGGLARQTIHSYPSSSGAGAGYDVNEQEAAQVLQSMSRRPSSARLQGRDAAPAQVQAP